MPNLVINLLQIVIELSAWKDEFELQAEAEEETLYLQRYDTGNSLKSTSSLKLNGY